LKKIQFDPIKQKKNRKTKTDFSSSDEIKQLDELLKISIFRRDIPFFFSKSDVYVQRCVNGNSCEAIFMQKDIPNAIYHVKYLPVFGNYAI